MANCLVLGANGFIGSHLVDSLADKRHQVRCFDRFKTEDLTFWNHEHHDTEIFRGDFLSRASIEEALHDMEYVFHFISTTTPISAENDPLIDIETNLRMSVVLFQLCVEKGIKKIIFASTGGAIYGDVLSDKPITEDSIPKPVSPYAIGKLGIENYLRYFNKKFNLPYQVLRISNPYGPRQNTLSGQGVIPIFLERAIQGLPLTIYGDGSMVRDYIYVKDVADMISESFLTNGTQEVYNIASGRGYSVNELVESIKKVIGKELIVEHRPKPVTFVNTITLDPSKFTKDFGIKAKVDLQEGISNTWQEIQKSHK